MGEENRAVQIQRIHNLLEQCGGRIAGNYLEEVANEEGDKAVIAIINKMPTNLLTEVIRKYDYSCPSIIPHLITAEKVKEIIEEEPAFWRSEFVGGSLDDTQRDASDLLAHLILTQESRERKIKLIKTIADAPDGVLFFIIALVGIDMSYLERDDNYLDMLFDRVSDTEKGSSSELLELIKLETPGVFKLIKETTQSEDWANQVRSFVEYLKNNSENRKIGIDSNVDNMFSPLE